MFSPDGLCLAGAISDSERSDSRDAWVGRIRIWDSSTGIEKSSIDAHSGKISGVAFSADGKRIASTRDEYGEIAVWEVETGDKITTFKKHMDPVSHVLFSPTDDQVISVGRESGNVRVWNVLSGEQTLMLRGHGAIDASILVSPDGRNFAFSRGDGIRMLCDVATGHLTRMNRRRTFHADGWDIDETLAKYLAAPKITEQYAVQVNESIWRRVSIADGKAVSNDELSLMINVCRDVPRAGYFNTLGVAQYRAGQFEAAIESLAKSLSQSGPNPADLSFLVMSHVKLANTDEAIRLRRQLDAAMKMNAFKNDVEAHQFLAEVNAVFESDEVVRDLDAAN